MSDRVPTRRRVEPEYPWERQPGESTKAYAVFCVYRDAGPLDRSYRKTAAELGRNVSWIKEWAKKYHWRLRCEDYDGYIEQKRRAAQEQAIVEMDDRHARIAALTLQKVAQRLVGDETAGVQAIDPSKLGAQDVARLMEVASKVERLARGADEKRAAGGDEGIKLRVTFDHAPVYPDIDDHHPDVELPPSRYRELAPGERPVEPESDSPPAP